MEIINITDEIIEVNVTEAVVNVVTQTGAYPLPSNVFSVFGRVGNVVGQAGDYTTSLVTEGTNLYYTDARSRAAISENITGIDYDNTTGIFSMASGYSIATNASQADWDTAFDRSLVGASVSGTTTKTLTLTKQDGATLTTSWSDYDTAPVSSVFGRTGSVIATSGDYTTDQVTEANNFYFTNARVHAAISATAPISEDSGVISISQANTSTNGYLSSTDWNTFNNKENFLASGTTAQYYRGDKTFQTLNTTAVAEGTNLYYTADRFNTAFSGKTTTDLAEGTNLYFTTARAQAAISGTLPISVSGGVVSISQSTGSSNGYLSSTDWNTFNSKQAALNGTGFVKISGTTISYDNSTYLTTIEGITAGGELSGTYASPSLVNGAVTGKILSGVNITGGTIADTDSILTAFGKLQNQINGLIGSSIYEGTWNATTNTPTLASGVGDKGSYYIVSVSGTTTIDGISDWNVGDWIIFDGTAWQQVDNTDAVVSVNGQTGAVSLTTDNITEGATNLYFTNGRAIASTLTGYTSGAGTISSSDTILQAIQKLNGNVSGLVTGVSSVFGRTGAVTASSGDYTTTQVTEGTNLYYTDVRVSANSDVSANTAARHSAVTLGTANGLSLSTQQLSLALASSSTTGALSSTDWNTFDGKQAALNGTGFVKISGTTISYDNTSYLPLTGGTLTGGLIGTTGSFVSSGNDNTFSIDHGSGSGIALNITKAGNGEGIYVNKTSGTGNAVTIVGTLNATTLVKDGGTSSQFLKADGSVDSSTYLTTSSAASTYLPLSGGTLTGALSGTSATFSGALTQNNVINLQNGGTTYFQQYIGGGGDLVFYNTTNNGFFVYTNSVERLGISGSGAATFSNDLSVNGISFLKNTTIGGATNTNELNIYATTSPTIKFQNSGADRGKISANSSSLIYNSLTGNGHDFQIDGSTKFSLAAITGAATFSSSVTAGSDLLFSNSGTTSINIRAISSSGTMQLTSGAAAGYSGGGSIELVSNDRSGTNTRGEVYISAGNASANTANGFIALSTANSERLRVTYGGNVGIGTSSPNTKLQVEDGHISTYHNINANGAGYGIQFYTNGGGSKNTIATIDIGQEGTARTGYMIFNTSNSGAPTERMRITSGGNVGIGTTSPSAKLEVDGAIYASGTGGFASATYQVNVRNPIWYFGNASSYGLSYFQGTAGYGGNDTIGFHFGGSTATSSGSTFQFIANGNYIFAGSPISDRRAKENINDLTFNGIEKVMALQSRSYYMKDGNNKIKYGFIAQEVYEVLPDLISGDLESDTIVGLDYNGLIPVLVKAIQELKAEIDELKNK